MNNYNILQIANHVDTGGQFELIHAQTTVTHNNKEYTYIATGLARDVFVSQDGKWVIKVPKNFDSWGFAHNALEVEAYNEAPGWCKKHIAESYLTEEGYVIQEFLNIRYIGDAYWRELGYREDETCVIFDCDILLNSHFEKPKSGFQYEKVFESSRGIFDPEIPKQLDSIKRQKRLEQKENARKHFPKITTGEMTVGSIGGYGGQHIYVYPKHLSLNECRTSEFEISQELALECGFILEIYED